MRRTETKQMSQKFASLLVFSVVAASSVTLNASALEPPVSTPGTSPTEPHSAAVTSPDTIGQHTGAPKKPWVHGDAPITETWDIHGDKCTVTYDQPEGSTAETQALFTETRDGLKAEMTGDLEARAATLDDNFTITRMRTGQKPKIICGKEAVLEAMKEESVNMAKHPPSSIEFYYPMAMIYGDSAVVNYKCLVVGRGTEPRRSYGWVTNVFVKHADAWKQIHRRSHWKVVRPGAEPSQSVSAPPSAIKDPAATSK